MFFLSSFLLLQFGYVLLTCLLVYQLCLLLYLLCVLPFQILYFFFSSRMPSGEYLHLVLYFLELIQNGYI